MVCLCQEDRLLGVGGLWWETLQGKWWKSILRMQHLWTRTLFRAVSGQEETSGRLWGLTGLVSSHLDRKLIK